jgi:dTDP-4-amino-4,6-dideoxygalactose transaminase
MEREPEPTRLSETRRGFLKSTGVLAATWYAAGEGKAEAAKPADGKIETLALSGGPKAVTRPPNNAWRWPLYGPDEEKAVVDLVRNPDYAPIDAFEKEWKGKFHYPFVKAQCNGTSALTSMFFALKLPPGSEIMVPSYTFFATIVPMRLFGLVPVFVDIDPRTLNVDLEDAKRRLTKNTKAVLPVHWIGLPCEMDQICDWANQKGLIVLEDSCHAHGASFKGKNTGNWGAMAAFSFQASKPLPGIEGGMAVYQTREHYERGSAFGHYDVPDSFPQGSAYKQFQGSGLGLKFRMHPLAAALLRCQFRGLVQRNEEGVAQVRSLNDRLTQLPGLCEQAPPRPDVKRIYYAWNMLSIDEKKAGMSRAACVKALQAEGVSASAHSYRLQHTLPLYRDPAYWHHLPAIPELPGSEQANAIGIALPYFTSPAPELVEQYVKAFEKVWAHRDELAKA